MVKRGPWLPPQASEGEAQLRHDVLTDQFRSDVSASTRLRWDVVGVTFVSSMPAMWKSEAYCASVRSRPPTATSMLMSKSFHSNGKLPGGITRSATSSGACFGMASLHFLR